MTGRPVYLASLSFIDAAGWSWERRFGHPLQARQAIADHPRMGTNNQTPGSRPTSVGKVDSLVNPSGPTCRLNPNWSG